MQRRALQLQRQNERVGELIRGIRRLGAVQFGQFTLKSGAQSPVYVDLRLLTSRPDLLDIAASSLWDAASCAPEADAVVGVPYTGLPLATAFSLQSGLPMIVKRKEAKAHGLARELEGDVRSGMRVLIVEDLATSGSSVLEVANSLRAAGLDVLGAVVLVDREQGAHALLESHSIALHSCMRVTEVLDEAVSAGDISVPKADNVKAWLSSTQFGEQLQQQQQEEEEKKQANQQAQQRVRLKTFEERAANCMKNGAAKHLFELIERKQSNLCVAADASSAHEVLAFADAVGPHVCCLKTHADAIRDFGREAGEKLLELSRKHDFIIFEDRKLADIGALSRDQFANGPTFASDWASMVSVHAIPGPGIIDGVAEASDTSKQGCVLLAQMSSDGSLADSHYAQQTLDMARSRKSAVAGIVCQSAYELSESSSDSGMVFFTPGVRFQKGAGELGQTYNTPFDAVHNRLADVVIVGGGITKTEDVGAAAAEYRKAAWEAYKQSLKSE